MNDCEVSECPELGIKICSFRYNFNDKLTKEHIEIIKKCETVVFKCKFNQSLDNLPNNVKQVSIQNNDYNKDLNNLPISLTFLIIECNHFSGDISFLPENLKVLFFKTKITNKQIENLPKLRYLCTYFSEDIKNLPDSIEYLKILNSKGNHFDVGEVKKFKIINLPKSLHTLVFYMDYYDENEDIIKMIETKFPFVKKYFELIIFSKTEKYLQYYDFMSLLKN